MKRLLIVLAIVILGWFITVKVHTRNVNQVIYDHKQKRINIAKREAELATKRLDSIYPNRNLLIKK